MFKKFAYLYEIPLFYLLLDGINRLFFQSNPGFLEIDPHPYWIGILIFSLRYGVMASEISGLFAIVFYLANAWFHYDHYLFHDLGFYGLPFAFVAVSLLVGWVIRSYQKKIGELNQNIEELNLEIKNDEEDIAVLKKINEGLEKKVVTRMSTLITLYEGARRLDTHNIKDLYKSIIEFISKTLDAQEAAIYLKTESGWRLEANYGWKDFQKRPVEFTIQQGITGMAGFKNKVVSVRDFLGSENIKNIPDLMGDCLFAGPVRCGENGNVIGVVSIQKIPFLKFNSSTLNLFNFLINWASRSIGKAHYVADLRSNEILDEEYQIFSKAYFHSRLIQEFKKSQKYYLPLSLGLIKIENIEKLPPHQIKLTTLAISESLKKSIRDLDVLGHFDKDGIIFGILMVTANEKQSLEIKENILNNFSRMKLESENKNQIPEIKIGISSFSPNTKDVDAIIKLAASNL